MSLDYCQGGLQTQQKQAKKCLETIRACQLPFVLTKEIEKMSTKIGKSTLSNVSLAPFTAEAAATSKSTC